MPRHSSPRPRAARRLARTLTTVALAVGLATTAGACTGGGDEKPESKPTPSSTPAAPVAVTVRIDQVAGSLRPAARKRVRAQITAVLQEYAADALLGDYPRSDFGAAFSSFTAGAAREARRDRDLLTGAAFANAQSVEPVALAADLAVLSPHLRPAGATARVRFVLAVDGTKVTLAGRLLLTPGRKAWRIFGYDLHRSDVPTGSQG